MIAITAAFLFNGKVIYILERMGFRVVNAVPPAAKNSSSTGYFPPLIFLLQAQ